MLTPLFCAGSTTMFAESDSRSRSSYSFKDTSTTLPSMSVTNTLRAAFELESHASKRTKHRKAVASLLLSRGSDSDSPERDDLSKSPAYSDSPDEDPDQSKVEPGGAPKTVCITKIRPSTPIPSVQRSKNSGRSRPAFSFTESFSSMMVVSNFGIFAAEPPGKTVFCLT